MTFAQRKFLVLAAWGVMVAALGLTLATNKPDLWVLIATIAIVPIMIGNQLWHAPMATLTELIAKGRSSR